MAMATWYLDALDAWTVGLCHSVRRTSRMLARELDVPYDQVRFRAGGINTSRGSSSSVAATRTFIRGCAR
jgi:alpha-galactosidase/6-phospho-beta-glucosidase family protein